MTWKKKSLMSLLNNLRLTLVRYFLGILSHSTDAVYSVCFSPSAPTLVATGGGDDMGTIWDASTGELKYKLEGHSDTVTKVAFSNNGELLATCGYEYFVAKVFVIICSFVCYTHSLTPQYGCLHQNLGSSVRTTRAYFGRSWRVFGRTYHHLALFISTPYADRL